MEGYINENRWVNLENLPKCQHNKSPNCIDWQSTVGCIVPFCFNNVIGQINILNYKKDGRRSKLLISINKYLDDPIWVRSDFITNCQFHNILSNRIINKAPEIVQFLYDNSDAYKYSYQSNNKVKTICPLCRNIDEQYISVLYKNGFSCPKCSDGFSIPNKIMYNILSQLNIPFIREVNHTDGFLWMKKYLYDFYFNINNINYLIEMDGGFHRWTKETDMIKTQLAEGNGFKLIRIDCDYVNVNPFQFIQNNIINSPLSTILNIELIDWNQCFQYVESNIVREVCDLWENAHMAIGEIMDKFNLSKTTVRRYLIRGKNFGWSTSYSKEESYKRGILLQKKKRNNTK